VDLDGPADRAGLHQGDILLSADGQVPKDSRAVARAVAMAPIGQALALGVWSDDKEQRIPVTVGEWSGDARQASVQPILLHINSHLRQTSLPPTRRRRFPASKPYCPRRDGFVISGAMRNEPALQLA
jgi:hypothetical protein